MKPHILYWICSHDVFNFTSLTYFQIFLSIAAPRQLYYTLACFHLLLKVTMRGNPKPKLFACTGAALTLFEWGGGGCECSFADCLIILPSRWPIVNVHV